MDDRFAQHPAPASQIPHLSAIRYRAPLPSVQTSAVLLE